MIEYGRFCEGLYITLVKDVINMTGTIAFVALAVVLVIVFVLERAKRPTPRALSVIMLLLVVYLVTKLVHGLVVMLAGGLPWWAALPLIVIVLDGVLVRGAMNMLATNYEGCSSPRERFTGKGSSAGYRFGNFFLAAMIGLGAMGMANFAPISELWVFLSSVIATTVCLVVHQWDGRHYGHEPAGQPKSSDSTPTKLYHDFIVWGLMVALHLTTWVPTVVQTVWQVFIGRSVDLGPAVAIVIVALIMAVVLAVKHQDIDYAKIHPAPTD